MAFEIRVPRLGWSMETGVFVRWLKRAGESVKVGDSLYELEGEKATQEIEAVDAGVLRMTTTSPAPGTEVAVGALLGYLAGKDEALPAAAAPTELPKQSSPPPIPADRPIPPPAGPAARRRAREQGIDRHSVAASNSTGPGRATDAGPPISTVARHSARVIASPRARRVARELGLDWQTLAGSGSHGRIRERDVRAATSGVAHAFSSPTLSPRRRTIAQRMLASSQQTAAVTLTTRANATNLVSLRSQFKATGGGDIVPSYTDIVARLVHAALRQHPVISGQSTGDLPIGIAVDTEAGLLVPVLRNIGSQTLLQLAAQTRELIEKARRGTLSMAEMTGGVFTITNLGGYGIDAFTPIINLPETAILGLGAIRREPVVLDDDRIAACDQLTLSLTFDHRLVDGAPAARFLQLVVSAIENPAAWLLG